MVDTSKYKRTGLCGSAYRYPTPAEIARVERRIAAMAKRKRAQMQRYGEGRRPEYVAPECRFASVGQHRKASTIIKHEP